MPDVACHGEQERREAAGGEGLAAPAHAHAALDLRETRCYGDERGLFHTGAARGATAPGRRPTSAKSFTLNTAIAAVGEVNYGRLGPGRQQRWKTANRALQLPAPEQPGAMPEIARRR